MKPQQDKLHFGRYDIMGFVAFISYSICSMAIPLVIVEMGNDLNFPLNDGGMSQGGFLHMMRSASIVIALLGCGFLAGRIGKRRSMGLSMLLAGGGIVLCAFAPNYWFLLPMLAIAGLGEGICEGIATPFLQDLHKEAPERYVNIGHSFWSVGIAASVIITGLFLHNNLGWRMVLLLGGLMALLDGFAFFIRQPASKQYPESTESVESGVVWKQLKAIAATPRCYAYCLAMAVGSGAEFCLTFWTNAYIRLQFNAGPWAGAAATAAIALGMFLGRFLVGIYAKPKHLKHIMLSFSLALLPVCILLLMIKPDTFSCPVMLWSAIMGLLFIGGFTVAPYWPTMQVYGVMNLPKLDSTMLYIVFSACGIPGCGFFTWLIGILGDAYGLQAAFVCIPASALAYAIIVYLEGWVFRNGRQQQ